MEKATMFDGQRLPFKISPTDAEGKPSEIQPGSLTAVPMGGTGLTATINDDGVSGFIHSPAGSLPGAEAVVISADADLGDGVETISVSVEIDVTHRRATNLGAVFGDAEDEPA